MERQKNNQHISFAPSILKRLGEELTPHIDQSLVELVKNAYDADAGHCVISIEAGESGVASVIEVRDDGIGMGPDRVSSGWLIFGESEKASGERTAKGRRPVGNKGLGRLAALRLGKKVLMTSVSADLPGVVSRVEIDWEWFARAKTVESVDIPVWADPNLEGLPPGTKIEIREVERKFSRYDMRKLAQALVMISDPFAESSGFSAVLHSSEFVDLERLVSQRYFTEADYYLVARVDEEGRASAMVKDWKGDVLFTAEHQDLVGEEQFSCPPLTFEFWTFLLNRETFSTKSVTQKEVRAWLAAFGGVHVYEKGIKVEPYGGGDDWLGINLQRVKSPEERPGTHNSIGRIALDNTWGSLVQKTDRSGYIDNESFREVKSFARHALDWMARQRLQQAELRRQSDKRQLHRPTETYVETVKLALEGIPGPEAAQARNAFTKLTKHHRRQIDIMSRELDLYRSLGTAGITASVFAHETAGNSMKVLETRLATLRRRTKRLVAENDWAEKLRDPFSGMEKALGGLGTLADLVLNLLKSRKRRRGAVSLWTALVEAVEMFRPILELRQVEVEFALAECSPWVLGSVAAVESVVANLVNNSLKALEPTSERRRSIRITGGLDNGQVWFDFEDSGTGIVGLKPADIWLPGQTTRDEGTGLGLVIVRDVVADLGGKVSVVPVGGLGGACFHVRLPLLRVS